MSQRRSVWIDSPGHARFEPHVGGLDVDVVVVGGGITGLTTALLLQRRGASVAVVEAGRIGAGTTGHSTGKVTSQHDKIYAELVSTQGADVAQVYADANEASIATIARIADECEADCDFTRAPSYLYTVDPEQVPELEREHAAASSLGLPAAFTTTTDLPFEVAGAVRFDDQAHLHIGRYTSAIARTLVRGGATISEYTRATDVEEHAGGATVRTDRGSVHGQHVVLATLVPFLDRGGFFAKLRPNRAYGVAALLSADAPAGMHLGVDSPTRSTRPWLVEGAPRGLVVVGESHPTGRGSPTPARFGELERWAREHFPVKSFEYRWSAQDHHPADRRPYVGRCPRTERVLVATGFAKWGLTNGTAAAEILTAMIDGLDHPWFTTFDATRIGNATAVRRLVEGNADVAQQFVTGWLRRLRLDSVQHLEPGEGAVVDHDGHAVGVHRTPDGSYQAVAVTCTHMRCTLAWNGAEHSWDCPCHGSRFAPNGTVLDGPAVRDLDTVSIEDPDVSVDRRTG